MLVSRFVASLVGMALLCGLAGCAPSGTDSVEPPVARSSISVDGLERTYIVHTPNTERPRAGLPLLIVLHGAGADAAKAERATGFSAAADANDFVVVYPDGTQAGEVPGEFSWNAEGCCGAPARNRVDDVAYIDNLITTLEAQFAIDPARVYVTGFSNGGMLSYRLSCALAERIAGIGVVGGAFNVTVCESPGPMPALVIHGTADATVPYDGGQTNERTAARFGQWENASVQDAERFWLDRNDCVDDTNADAGAEPSGQPSMTDVDGILTETWTECAADSRFELVSIYDGTHVWPTLDNEDFDASGAILDYFGLQK